SCHSPPARYTTTVRVERRRPHAGRVRGEQDVRPPQDGGPSDEDDADPLAATYRGCVRPGPCRRVGVRPVAAVRRRTGRLARPNGRGGGPMRRTPSRVLLAFAAAIVVAASTVSVAGAAPQN